MPAIDQLSALVCDGCGLTEWFARELDDPSFAVDDGNCGRCGSFRMAAEPTHEHLEPLSTFRTWLLGRRPSGWLSLRLCRACGHTEWYAQPDDLRCLGEVR
jgi:ribosomal protein S27AE